MVYMVHTLWRKSSPISPVADKSVRYSCNGVPAGPSTQPISFSC